MTVADRLTSQHTPRAKVKLMCSSRSSIADGTVAGLFAGLSLEGTGLVERGETNAAFYGTRVPASDLLACV